MTLWLIDVRHFRHLHRLCTRRRSCSLRAALSLSTSPTTSSYNGRTSRDLIYDDLSCFRRRRASRVRSKRSRMGCSRGSSGTGTAGESMARGAKGAGMVDSAGVKSIQPGDKRLGCGLKEDRRGFIAGNPTRCDVSSGLIVISVLRYGLITPRLCHHNCGRKGTSVEAGIESRGEARR